MSIIKPLGLRTQFIMALIPIMLTSAAWAQGVHAIVTNNPAEDTQPKLATDSGANLLCAWFQDSSPVAGHSSDNGATWSAPSPIAAALPPTTGFESMQVTYAGGNAWLCNKIIVDPAGLDDTQVLSFKSTDSGQTWSAAYRIDAGLTTPTLEETGLTMAADGAGNIMAVWREGSTFSVKPKLFMAKSSDFGNTWSAPLEVLADPNESSIQAQIIYGAGKWILADSLSSPSLLPGVGIIAVDVATSTNFGTTWDRQRIMDRNRAATDHSFYYIDTFAVNNTVALQANLGGMQANLGVDNFFKTSTDGGGTWSDADTIENSVLIANSVHVAGNTAGRWALIGDTGNDALAYSSGNITAPWPADPLNVAADTGKIETAPSVVVNDNGEFVIAYQTADVISQGNNTDFDIHIIRTPLTPPPAAARDWTIYE